MTDQKEGLGQLVSRLAATNIVLWHEEDKARVPDDHQVAAAKRNVDKLNQQRNDLIERIDDELRSVAAAAATAKAKTPAAKARKKAGKRG
jgi:hypothetical protein